MPLCTGLPGILRPMSYRPVRAAGCDRLGAAVCCVLCGVWCVVCGVCCVLRAVCALCMRRVRYAVYLLCCVCAPCHIAPVRAARGVPVLVPVFPPLLSPPPPPPPPLHRVLPVFPGGRGVLVRKKSRKKPMPKNRFFFWVDRPRLGRFVCPDDDCRQDNAAAVLLDGLGNCSFCFDYTHFVHGIALLCAATSTSFLSSMPPRAHAPCDMLYVRGGGSFKCRFSSGALIALASTRYVRGKSFTSRFSSDALIAWRLRSRCCARFAFPGPYSPSLGECNRSSELPWDTTTVSPDSDDDG